MALLVYRILRNRTLSTISKKFLHVSQVICFQYVYFRRDDFLFQEDSFVRIVEVGPRDGLQNEPVNVPSDIKIEFINKLSDTGLKTIEVTR